MIINPESAGKQPYLLLCGAFLRKFSHFLRQDGPRFTVATGTENNQAALIKFYLLDNA